MLKINYKSLVVVILVILFPKLVFAGVMSSQNYIMPASIIGSGGLSKQSSANYSIDYTSGKQLIYTAPVTNKVNTGSTATPVSAGGGIVGGGGSALPSSINAFNVPLEISPTQSGVLKQNVSGGEVVVKVPKGNFTSKTTFVVKEVPLKKTNTWMVAVSTSLVNSAFYDITAKDLKGNFVTSFSSPISISLPIPKSLLNTKKLGVYWFNTTDNKWIVVPGVVFSKGFAKFEVKHFTRFAVFGTDELLKSISVDSGLCDVDKDGKVGILDFNSLMVHWGETGPGNTADCSNNNIVGIIDFNILMKSWSI